MSDTNQQNPLLNKNLHALLQINPQLANKILAIKGNSRFEVFQGKDPIDINLLDVEKEAFMYAYPVADIVALSDELTERNNLPYRYLFGIGNTVALQMILKEPLLESLIVIEPNHELYYIAFHFADFSEAILSKKLILEDLETASFAKISKIIHKTQAQYYVKLFTLETISNYYLHYYPEEIRHINNIFLESFKSIALGYGNDATDTLMGIEHHIQNLPRMIEGPMTGSLLEAPKQKTAIVVSTGPSLTKQIPLLKKIKDYVTIISVDASFPILEKHGIKPDFVTVLERIPETGNFFKNNAKEFQDGVNFVLVSIAHQDVINAIRGGTLLLQMRPHGYTKFFGLDSHGYLGVGMSAANLAHELAIAMHFENVILIGQDLAFGDDGTSHASNHYFGVDEEKTEGHEEYVERYGGNGVIRTTQYWVMFKNYFERAIHETRDSILTINSTEGGARIPGALELPFAEAIEKYVDTSLIKEPIVLSSTPPEKIEEDKQRIVEKVNLWIKDSIERQEKIEETFLHVQEASENFVQHLENNELEKINIDELSTLMSEIDVIKAFIEEPIFYELYFDLMQSQILHMEFDFVKIRSKKVTNEEERKAKMVEWIMAHRLWLFSLAGGLNEERETIIKALSTWPIELKKKIVIPEKVRIEVDEEKYNRLKNISEELDRKYKEGMEKLNLKVEKSTNLY